MSHLHRALGDSTARSLLDRSKPTDEVAGDLHRSAQLLEESGGDRRDLPRLIQDGLARRRGGR